MNDDDTCNEDTQHLILKFYDSKTISTTYTIKSTKFSIIAVVTCFSSLLLAIYFKDSILNIFIYLDTIESENYFLLNLIILLLFLFVSLPILWGYSLCVLIISYLYDFFYGFILTSIYSAAGMALCFFSCRYLFSNISCLSKYTSVSNTNNIYFTVFVNCIEGSNGYKIILLSRIVPLPFGLTNLLYSMTKISFYRYIIASTIGLIPTQLLTCYIGSTLKSISDIIAYSTTKTAVHAYYIFAIQLLISFVLMYYLVKLAKAEFDKSLNIVVASLQIQENKSENDNTNATSSNINVISTNELVN